MRGPVNIYLDHEALARRFLLVEMLHPSELMIFKAGQESYWIGQSHIVKHSKATKTELVTNKARVCLTELPLECTVDFEIKDIREVPRKLAKRIADKELKLLLKLLEAAAKTIVIKKKDLYGLAYDKKRLKAIFAKAFAKIEKNDLVVNKVLIHKEFPGLKELKACWFGAQFPVEDSIWGADICESSLVPKNTIYVCADAEYLGIRPIRTDVEVFIVKNKKNFTAIGLEIFGMGILNPKGVVKIKLGE
jgi:hypothetical protein